MVITRQLKHICFDSPPLIPVLATICLATPNTLPFIKSPHSLQFLYATLSSQQCSCQFQENIALSCNSVMLVEFYCRPFRLYPSLTTSDCSPGVPSYLYLPQSTCILIVVQGYRVSVSSSDHLHLPRKEKVSCLVSIELAWSSH